MSTIWFIVIVTAVCVFFDARSIGIGKLAPGESRGFLDMSPIGWAFACLLLWIIAFPLYLVHRNQFVRQKAAFRSQSRFAELERLADLKERGVLTEEEFQHQKKNLLG